MSFFSKYLKNKVEQAEPAKPNSAVLAKMQAAASVQMLEQMLMSKRCSEAELERAKRRLEELSEIEVTKPHLTPSGGSLTQVVKPVLDGSVLQLRAELMSQIDKLSKKRAEVSNQMHLVPITENCAELMHKALQIHEELEAVWTKYRYLERNGRLPDEDSKESKQISIDILLKMDEKKKYIEKRSKLAKKIASPLNKKHKKLTEWQEEYEYAVLEIQRLTDEIYLLKNR